MGDTLFDSKNFRWTTRWFKPTNQLPGSQLVIHASGPRAVVRSERSECACEGGVYTVLPSVRTS